MGGNTDTKIAKGRSPYRVSINPPYARDNSGAMNAAFQFIRQEQESQNNQLSALVGNLDSLSGDFKGLFTNLVTIRQKLNQTQHLPFIKAYQLRKVEDLKQCVDKVSAIITNEIVPLIDELGK